MSVAMKDLCLPLDVSSIAHDPEGHVMIFKMVACCCRHRGANHPQDRGVPASWCWRVGCPRRLAGGRALAPRIRILVCTQGLQRTLNLEIVLKSCEDSYDNFRYIVLD